MAEVLKMEIEGREIKVDQTSPQMFTVSFCGMEDYDLDYHEAKSAIGDAVMEALRLSGKVTKDVAY